ncbi:MAG: glycosyltransferase family 4 protein [Flavisolibacter sp.]
MPKVIRILNRLAVGGPVLNAAYLTKYLAPDFQTVFVVGKREGHEKSASYLADQLGIDYVEIKGMGRSIDPFTDFNAFKELKGLIKKFKPDIVHTHAAKPGALGRLAASSSKVPVIVHTFHGHIFHSYFNTVKTKFFIATERYLATKSDAIIAISDQQRKELALDFKIAPFEKFHVIPLGFDLEKFRLDQGSKRLKFRSEFNLPEDTIAIGIIGRLVPVKNHYLFLKAISYVLSHTRKPIRAFIIGDGETRKDLENVASQIGLAYSNENSAEHTKPLVFTSWRSDVDLVNAGLDIVCLTSFNEGTPVSLIEAQAANKPVISTRVGGIGDIVIEGETALLANVEEPEVYCKHLLEVVENEELRKKMGFSSHAHIFKQFGVETLVRNISKLYYELLEKKSK